MEEDATNTEIITSFVKNRTETVVFSINEYMGRMLADIRLYYHTASQLEPVPTRKGVSLEVSQWPELFAAIQALGAHLTSEGTVAEIKKSDAQIVRVSTRMYRERMLMDIRVMTRYKNSEEYRFTQKGTAMSVELYEDLLEAAGKLDEAVRQLGAA